MTAIRLAFGLLAFAALVAAGDKLPRIHVHPETGHFVDEYGRVRMFRGVNSVQKAAPWYEKGLNKDQWLKGAYDIGMNVVRLGNMWTGWQPDGPDSYDETYAAKITEIMDEMEDFGMYTLLDMHQDVLWKEKGVGYFGVPPWIKAKMDVSRAHQYPWPLVDTTTTWECGYFTEHIAVAFQNYYDNQNGVLDDNANFYREVVRRFKGRSNILGYEIINEPSFGDIYSDVTRLLPGVTGKEDFVNYYNKIHKSVREHDQEALIFWEPTTWSYILPFDASWNGVFDWVVKHVAGPHLNQIMGLICNGLQPNVTMERSSKRHLQNVADFLGHKSIYKFLTSIQPYLDYSVKKLDPNNPPVWGPGLVEPPGGLDFANRTAMSWHYYCLFVAPNPTAGNADYKPFQKAVCDDLLGPMTFKTVEKRSKEIGGGRMLTEFGECWPDTKYPNSQNVIECNFVMDKADEHFMSWTLWDSNVIWDSHGTQDIKPNTAIFFARPYPQATAGTPVKLSFDWKTKHFEYEYSLETLEGPVDTDAHPTEIVVPDMQYPNGSYQVQVTPGFKWQVSQRAPNVIEIVKDKSYVVDLPVENVKVVIAHANAIL